ncbi:helix-turn-helix transcriptional regulator [Granulicella tundricola]|uniref:Transcriptional regulator, AraC family n=1 Tax=Granulicella tundricola (strain ATCC BAA-1859 / DSM 23138 / MP5ACTX9) TaxID=1198114 RepID=E8WVD4_GRATM|nr:AraC family transcriptional regulator [Granulicella tundricola]ADW68382.1 transcriptional regulator, AraC family [Granulicella tundricola MP5ACTX9]
MVEETGLQLQHLESFINPEPTYYMQHQQSLAKVLSPGRYQHGIIRNKLIDYSYAAGDLIVCNRGIDEFVRWDSDIRILKVDLPDEAFRAIANEAGADSVEIHSSTHFEDKRVAALIAAIQAEEEGGSLSGRLYMDSIAQALASALVQLRGNLKRSLPHYHCGLTPTQLARVKHLVYGRIDQEISLQEMATAAGLSASYFNQMFRRSTGQPAHQFVLNARVEHAKDLLKSPKLRMLDVAISCGFRTSQHFARVFRSICAVTPTEYRRALGIRS